MIENTKFVMQRVLAMIFICLLTTPVVLRQTQLRVVHLWSYGDQQPVKFELKFAGEIIIADKPFVADEDWLKDLSWSMKNSSDKPIVCIEVDLDFHGLGNSKDERVYKFRYGQKPDAQNVNGEPELLMPGKTASFKLSEAEYNEIKQFVEQKQPSEGVGIAMSVIEMKIVSVCFEDKTMWKDGR